MIGAGAFVALLFVIGVAGGGSNSSSSSTPQAAAAEPEPQAAPRQVAPPIEIAANALFRAYKDNEVSADDAYKGKRLLVTGHVASIDKDMFDHIIVRLASGSMFQTVDATMMPSEKSQAAGLHKGTAVSVLCTGNGKVMDPQLDDCEFAK